MPRVGIATFLLSAVLVAPASAAVPSAARSSVDVSIPTSPDGTLEFRVIVRDLADNLIANATVFVDFTECASFTLCTPCADDYHVQGTRLIKITGVDGTARFRICGAGRCGGGVVQIHADGVLFGSRPFAPADQDGDQLVEASDVAAIQGLEGSTDLAADLDHDGAVTAADTALAQARLGEACFDPTPSRSTTWGRVKTIYR
jgi:hypothetical protein